MQTDLNVCKIHPNKPQNMVCEGCKKILCSKCIKINHEDKWDHKPFLLKTKLMNSYQFLEYLGEGSYGYVLSAIKDMSYAIKFIDDITEMSMMEEATMEILTFSSLNHPNIVRFYRAEYLKEEKRMVVFMELADNSLTDVFSSLDQSTAIKYFIDICKGLKYLHNSHFVHRDMKPGNILIKDKVAKLSDFGLTKKSEKSMISWSDKANLFGTLSYLSPEVLNGEKYNEKCDIWALGIIFHQLLSNGTHLFKGENMMETKLKILNPEINIHENIAKNNKFERILRGISLFKYIVD